MVRGQKINRTLNFYNNNRETFQGYFEIDTPGTLQYFIIPSLNENSLKTALSQMPSVDDHVSDLSSP